MKNKISLSVFLCFFFFISNTDAKTIINSFQEKVLDSKLLDKHMRNSGMDVESDEYRLAKELTRDSLINGNYQEANRRIREHFDNKKRNSSNSRNNEQSDQQKKILAFIEKYKKAKENLKKEGYESLDWRIERGRELFLKGIHNLFGRPLKSEQAYHVLDYFNLGCHDENVPSCDYAGRILLKNDFFKSMKNESVAQYEKKFFNAVRIGASITPLVEKEYLAQKLCRLMLATAYFHGYGVPKNVEKAETLITDELMNFYERNKDPINLEQINEMMRDLNSNWLEKIKNFFR